MTEHARLPIEPERPPQSDQSSSDSTSSVDDFKSDYYRELLHHLVVYLAATNGIYLLVIASIGSLAHFDQMVLSTLTMGTVIGTAVWVGLDAKDRGATGITAANWALGCITLWIFAFPFYLARRAMSPDTYRPGYIG